MNIAKIAVYIADNPPRIIPAALAFGRATVAIPGGARAGSHHGQRRATPAPRPANPAPRWEALGPLARSHIDAASIPQQSGAVSPWSCAPASVALMAVSV